MSIFGKIMSAILGTKCQRHTGQRAIRERRRRREHQTGGRIVLGNRIVCRHGCAGGKPSMSRRLSTRPPLPPAKSWHGAPRSST